METSLTERFTSSEKLAHTQSAEAHSVSQGFLGTSLFPSIPYPGTFLFAKLLVVAALLLLTGRMTRDCLHLMSTVLKNPESTAPMISQFE